MPKDYYLVLGIRSDASTDDIKAAYRRLAKAYHPDRYGNNHSPFLAIQEAYSVLSDPKKRASHDLANQTTPAKGNRVSSGPKRYVEPLIPGQPMNFGTANGVRPFHGPLFDGFPQRPFGHWQQTENLEIVIRLTPGQAFRGGRVRVTLPQICPACVGQGFAGPCSCPHCSGKGLLPGVHPVMIAYPPGMPDHHVVELRMTPLGVNPFYVTVRFCISERL